MNKNTKRKKRTVFLYLAVLLLIQAMTAVAPGSFRAFTLTAYAKENSDSSSESAEVLEIINPIYSDLEFEEAEADGIFLLQGFFYQAEEPDKYSSIEEAAAYLRAQMQQRAASVIMEIDLQDTAADQWNAAAREIFNTALVHTGEILEGDYIKYHWYRMKASFTAKEDSDHCSGSLSYTLTYFTTAEEEEAVTAKTAQVLKELDLQEKTEYEKALSIYQYLTQHVAYSYNQSQTDMRRYSTYGALINEEALCQGIATAFYRLASEAGLSCRVIPGLAKGVRHAWNIIRVDGKYYNVDATWDLGENKQTYAWFLKGSGYFPDHTREDEYLTEEFENAWPADAENYTEDGHVALEAIELSPLELTFDALGTEKNLMVQFTPSDASNQAVAFSSSNTKVATVNKKGVVTSFGNGSCTITAKSLEGSFTASCEVSVNVQEDKIHFTDVSEGAYYYEPVYWGVDSGIVKGTSADTFSPERVCTRAQLITFLYRIEGMPDVGTVTIPFTDVSEDAYYYDAVRWAYSKGITFGKSVSMFAPEDVCTRAQTVALLYRYSKENAESIESRFLDVPEDAYYYQAVSWAYSYDITKGTSNELFSPNESCTRGQCVTFLYRFCCR